MCATHRFILALVFETFSNNITSSLPLFVVTCVVRCRECMYMYRDLSRDLVVQYYVPCVRKTRIYRDVSRTMYCSSTLLEHMNTKKTCDMCFLFKKHVTWLKCVHVFCQKIHKHQNDTSCVIYRVHVFNDKTCVLS